MKNKSPLTAVPEPLMLRADQASALCGLSVSTWYQLKASGQLPPSIKLGKARLWPMDTLKSWISLGCPTHEKYTQLAESNKGGR
jgi:predicted DNA-binding transcriptional regulator AlpA